MAPELSSASPLLTASFAFFSLSAIGLGAVAGAIAGSLLFNPIHF